MGEVKKGSRKMAMHQIHKLNARHFRVLDLVLEGKSNKDIAAEVRMGESAVSVLVRSPSFQHELAIRRGVRDAMVDEKAVHDLEPAMNELRKNALLAAQRITDGLHEEGFGNRKAAAVEVLDRVGITKVNKSEVDIKAAHVILSSEDAKVLQETLRMVV